MTRIESTQIHPSDDITIYQHSSRADWGKAILAWERGDRRAYQFEDGKLRVFKDGWYHLISEVDQPLGEAETTAQRLRNKLELTPRQAPAAKHDGLTLDDQRRVLSSFYPDGFAGEAWAKDKRGEGASRHLKRHRNAVIAKARGALSAHNLDTLIGDDNIDQAWDAILGVLACTDLVTKRQIAPLAEVSPDRRRALVIRTRDLLWGEERYEIRFERFIAALAMATGKTPPWQLATVLSALVHPDEHVCIHNSTARAQASWMAPRLQWNNTPSAQLYTRLQRMVHTTRSALIDANLPPTDLLDVYDFMRTTLGPGARRQLEKLDAGLAVAA